MITEELLKQDLLWQLSFDDIDWDYFIQTAEQARELQEKEIQE